MSQTSAYLLATIGVIGVGLSAWMGWSQDGTNTAIGIRVCGALMIMFSSLIFVALCWLTP